MTGITDLLRAYKIEMIVQCSYTAFLTVGCLVMVARMCHLKHSCWLVFLTLLLQGAWVYSSLSSIFYFWQLNELFGSGMPPTPDQIT